MCINIYIYIYTYVHTYIHTYIHTRTHSDRRTDRQRYIHTYDRALISACRASPTLLWVPVAGRRAKDLIHDSHVQPKKLATCKPLNIALGDIAKRLSKSLIPKS